MKQKTITLMGRELKMAMNMGALICYERITGKNALDYTQFGDGKLEPILTLGYSMILGSNDESVVPAFDDVLQHEDIEELGKMMAAASELYMEFISPKKGDAEQGKKGKKGEDPKNA